MLLWSRCGSRQRLGGNKGQVSHTATSDPLGDYHNYSSTKKEEAINWLMTVILDEAEPDCVFQEKSFFLFGLFFSFLFFF